jgi:predicted GNAT family acetyltransferase
MIMIRKLTSLDNEQLMALVLPQASINLFIIGDIEMYGYETDFQELWGDFDEQSNLRGVLLRYYENFIVYGGENYDANGFVEIIESFEFESVISGEQSVIKSLQPLLKEDYQAKDTYFAECRAETLNVTDNEQLLKQVKRATVADATKLVELLFTIEEFAMRKSLDFDQYVERTIKRYVDQAGRDYFIEADGKVVSIVQTAAENSKSAMIIGVCTEPSYRLKGYTTAILSKLLQDLLTEKESACLFYDNPKAGSIYKRSGFVDIGMWTMLMPKDASDDHAED